MTSDGEPRDLIRDGVMAHGLVESLETNARIIVADKDNWRPFDLGRGSGYRLVERNGKHA